MAITGIVAVVKNVGVEVEGIRNKVKVDQAVQSSNLTALAG